VTGGHEATCEANVASESGRLRSLLLIVKSLPGPRWLKRCGSSCRFQERAIEVPVDFSQSGAIAQPTRLWGKFGPETSSHYSLSTFSRPHPLSRSIQPLLLAGVRSFHSQICLQEFSYRGFWLQTIERLSGFRSRSTVDCA
jgi:hypothetical protein